MTTPTTTWKPTRPAAEPVIDAAASRRRRVLERDEHVCAYCGCVTIGEAAHVDLRIPICEGSSATDDRWYAVFCGPCYAVKKQAERERWRGSDKAEDRTPPGVG